MLKEHPVHTIQVRGVWAGDASPGWRPAVAGTLNQTGGPDEEASTFSSLEEAESTLDFIKTEGGVPDEPAAGVPEFRITQGIRYEITPDSFSKAALESIEETGINPVEDLERLLMHRVTPAELLEECLQGAEDDREEGWRDYVSALDSLANP
jgi:hypothetical protein